MFRNLSIKIKLFMGFALVSLLLVSVGFIEFLTINGMRSDMQDIVKSSTYMKAVMEMKYSVAGNLEAVKDMLMASDQEAIEAANEKAQKFYMDFEFYAEALLTGSKKDGYTIYPVEDDEMRKQVTKNIEFYKTTINPRVKKIYDTKLESADGNVLSLAIALNNLEKAKAELNMSSTALLQGLGSLEQLVKTNISQEKLKSIGSAEKTSLLSLLGLVVSLLIATVIAFFINKDITEPLTKCVAFARAIADGDLTQTLDIDRGDATGMLASTLNMMAGNLREIVDALAHSTDVLAASSEQLSATIRELVTGSSMQAQQTEQSATSMTEMAQTIMEVAKNAGDVADSAEDTIKTAEEGNRKVTETVEGIRNIADTVHKSSQTVEELGSSSQEIGNIVNTINEIADQTNLLALNAAIEAARAGEQGRGFAVVADEVRKLAERTAKATKEIGGMILHIQQSTSDSVESMQSGKEGVDNGIKLAEEAMEALLHIVESANQSADMVRRIASATEEQSSAVEEVSVTIDEIASVTQQSKRSAEQLAQSVEELSKVAIETNSLVQWFQV